MMTREEALARIKMNPNMVPAGQDPEAFIAAMMAADAANSAPMTPPVEVSPADPAPVQAGIPIVAPPPMAPPMPPMATDFRNQAVLAANQTRPPGTDLISGNSGQDVLLGSAGKDVVVPAAPAAPPAVAPPKLTRTPEEMQDLVQGNVDAIAKARRSAVLPEEQREYFDAIRQRTDAELADVGKERKQQYWMALAMAGAKMAQSQSPYFATAVAEGLESGLTGFNKARADASEKKARLQTRKEDLILKRYEALRGAQADIINDMKAGREMTAADLNMANASSEQLLRAATAEDTVKRTKAEATEAEVKAKFAPRLSEAQLGLIGSQTRAADANAYESYKRGDAAKAAVGQAEREGKIPTGVYNVYAQDMTTARTYLEAAGKFRKGSPEQKKYLDKSMEISERAQARVAKYFDETPRLASPTNPLGLKRPPRVESADGGD